MASSEKLAVRTYPGLQELHSQLQKFKNYFPQISNTSSRKLFLNEHAMFYMVVHLIPSHSVLINCWLKMIQNTNYLLTDVLLSVLRTQSNAHHFALIILSHFYNSELLLILFDTKQSVYHI